jgi:hypothetical protein
MNQALYANMNNKIKMKKKIPIKTPQKKKKRRINLEGNTHAQEKKEKKETPLPRTWHN